MATIRKRTLPSGLVRWQVDFTDQAGKRREQFAAMRRVRSEQFVARHASIFRMHLALAGHRPRNWGWAAIASGTVSRATSS